MPYVLSRLANSQEYILYDLKTPNGVPREAEAVLVRGGADVTDSRTLITPLGAVTPVSKEQAALLKQNPVFKAHLENKLVELCDKKPEPEAAPDNLDADASRQVTSGDYSRNGKDAPKTGAPEA